MKQIGKKIGLKFIYVMRQLFANTPIQKWRLTAVIYEKLFHVMYGKKDVEAEYKGIRMLLPTKDATIVPSILGGYFEALELDLFSLLAPESDCMLDVGGNIGLYAALGGKLNPKAKIFSFEPIEENIGYFKKNLALNKVKNVKIEQAAVGASKGSLKIYLSDTNVGTHSAAQQTSLGKQSVEVPMLSLDDYVKKNKLTPDLIKVDVEGYDGFVFDGAIETIKKHKPTLFAEYGPRMMQKCGYDSNKFLDMLFKNAEEAYIFEEKTGTLRPVTQEELAKKSVACVENLLFVSSKKHKRIVSQYLS